MFGWLSRTITPDDILRGVSFVDGYVMQNERMIPFDVREAWATLRAALLGWRQELIARAGRNTKP